MVYYYILCHDCTKMTYRSADSESDIPKSLSSVHFEGRTMQR